MTIPPGSLESTRLVVEPTIDRVVKEPVKSRVHTQIDCKLLLAEDSPDNQRLISFLLRKQGATVEIAENGRRAVDCALAAEKDGEPFDVILMDMMMPVLDGYSATQELRKRGYAGSIVALTANAMSDDRAKCLAVGCDDYTTKPIHREHLLEIIQGRLEAVATTP